MDLIFSPSRRRLYWNEKIKWQLVQEVDRLPVSQRECFNGQNYKKIQYVHDLVRADCRTWLQGLSMQNLRYLLARDGDWPETAVDSFTRQWLIGLLVKACVAGDEVERLLVQYAAGKLALCRVLRESETPFQQSETMVALVNKLVIHRSKERDHIRALPELQQQTQQHARPARTIHATPSTTVERRPDQAANTNTQSTHPTVNVPVGNRSAAPQARRPRLRTIIAETLRAIDATPTSAPVPPTIPPPTAVHVGPARPESASTEPGNVEHTCNICVSSPVNSVFTPCGHQSACIDCAQEWIKIEQERLRRSGGNVANTRCPVCRQVTVVIKTYAV